MRTADQAPRDHVRLAVLKVAYLMEPEMEPTRLRALVEYIADQKWTSADLALAADCLPRDDYLDAKVRYGGCITPADFERVIEGAREVANNIKRPLTKKQMERALQLEPQLSRDDFELQKRPHDDEDRWLLSEAKLEALFDMDRSRL